MARGERFVDGYLAALLAQASHRVSREFHRLALEAGVPVAEWRILASLTGADALPVGRLAELVLVPQPTLTRQLDRMARKGLVERVGDASDRRLALVHTTPAGDALAARLVRLARTHERQVLAPFGQARAEALKRMLVEIIAGEPPTATQDSKARSTGARKTVNASGGRR